MPRPRKNDPGALQREEDVMGTVILLSDRKVAGYKQVLKAFNSMSDSQEKWEVEYPKLEEKVAVLRRTKSINKMLERDGWL